MPTRRCLDEASVSSLYRNRFQNVSWCLYCGDRATTIDHLLPVSSAAELDWSKPATDKYRRLLITLPCCRHCNSVAGGRFFYSFFEKRRFIQNRLREKYSKYLAVPRWSQEELDELGRGLYDYVKRGQDFTEGARLRIMWPRSRPSRKKVKSNVMQPKVVAKKGPFDGHVFPPVPQDQLTPYLPPALAAPRLFDLLDWTEEVYQNLEVPGLVVEKGRLIFKETHT